MSQDYGRADMHMHTNVSDGAVTVQALLKHISTRPLDVIAITDHDRLSASLWAYEHQDEYPFEVVPGLEVTAYDGHVLAWWVTQKIPHGLRIEETAQAIHEAGGIAILAHPFHINVEESKRGAARYGKNPHLVAEFGFDGVEVVNAGNVLLGTNWYSKTRFADVPLAKVGNSDAHTPHSVGSGGTRFEGKTAADLRAAILQRKTQPLGGLWPPMGYIGYAQGVMNGSIVYTPIDEELRAKSSQNTR